MKKILLTLGLILLTPLAIAGHHVNGTWSMNVELGGQQGGTATFELEEGDGGSLTGTYSGALGNTAVSGTVNAMEVEFSFDSQAGKVTTQPSTPNSQPSTDPASQIPDTAPC